MNLDCSGPELAGILRDGLDLLSDSNLAARGAVTTENLRNFRLFLGSAADTVESAPNLGEALTQLQNVEISTALKPYWGLIGRVLDAVQVLKTSATRHSQVAASMVHNLDRTGHRFVWDELPQNAQASYKQELVSACASYLLVEAAHFGAMPITTLRRSMGERTPEEYFGELLSGWVIEDAFVSFLRNKGFQCELPGHDSARRIQFVRPSQEMGAYDLLARHGGATFLIELQRVRQFTMPANEQGFIKTFLKSHKFVRGDEVSKILLLWFGAPKQLKYANLTQRVVAIPNVSAHRSAWHSGNDLRVQLEFTKRAKTWQELAKLSAAELARYIQGTE